MTYQSVKGLEDVSIGESSISFVGGETGELIYRGYNVQLLVGRLDYESVAHLLLRGRLPSAEEAASFRRSLASKRTPGPSLLGLVDALDPRTPPIDALRTIASALGDGSWSYPPTEDSGLTLISETPTLLARFFRRRSGLAAVPPDPKLAHVANYLFMLTGTPPPPAHVRALEDYFILLADHGMNASTFALRTVLSTQAELPPAVAAALAALKGPLHGGAPSRVVEMLDAIGNPDAARAWIQRALDRRERLFGFGHRAYKVEDPRAECLRSIAEPVADPSRFKLYRRVEEEALTALHARKPGQRLYTNVEFYGAGVMEAVGLPRELFTPTFALARTAGWVAQALEQCADNRLIRPEIRYTGPRGLTLDGPAPPPEGRRS